MVVGGIDGVGSGLGYRGVGAFAELGWLAVVLYGNVAGGWVVVALTFSSCWKELGDVRVMVMVVRVWL